MINKGRHFYEFGAYRIDPDHRQLLRQNQPVQIQPKAFDILLALVANSEKVVLKDDLMKTVWPDTFVEESNLAQHIFVLRKTLGDAVGENRYIVTVPGRGYRFAERVRAVVEELPEVKAAQKEENKRDSQQALEQQEKQIVVASRSLTKVVIEKQRDLRLWVAIGAAVVTILIAAGVYWRSQVKPLTEKDTIVLADFDNKTGDPVFDGTLRQGLSAQLEQSPFLNLLSDQLVRQTLALMAQPRDARLTQETALEVCQRTASKAVLGGSIAQIGTRYLLTLQAINCSTGESLASTESDANDKNHVLDSLGKVASEIRSRLGESLASVQKYDVAPENVTTSSLEALKAYSLGIEARKHGLEPSVSLFQRAITLDPNFAMAYAQTGVVFFNLDDTVKAADYIRKAYDLRGRVSDHEAFYITSHYEDMVTRDLESSRKIYELWQKIYPRDGIPFNNLGTVDIYLGDWDQVLAMTAKGRELNQRKDDPNLVSAYIYLNRLDEAKKMAMEGASGADAALYLPKLYTIDFLQRDVAGMQRDEAQLAGKPELEISLLYSKSEIAAYFGRFSEARELNTRLSDEEARIDNKPMAAVYQALGAVREAFAGNSDLARQQAKMALMQSNAREVEGIAAVALAHSGDAAEATRLADDLDKRYPKDTVVHMNFLPTVRAAVALRANAADKAIQALQAASPHELGFTDLSVAFCLYPVYLRGEAYLMAKRGEAAAAEFQKIVDHPGLVQTEPIGALAHLGLARSYVLSGDRGKAKLEYQNFLTLWKDADSDPPILKQAKAESAKL